MKLFKQLFLLLWLSEQQPSQMFGSGSSNEKLDRGRWVIYHTKNFHCWYKSAPEFYLFKLLLIERWWRICNFVWSLELLSKGKLRFILSVTYSSPQMKLHDTLASFLIRFTVTLFLCDDPPVLVNKSLFLGFNQFKIIENVICVAAKVRDNSWYNLMHFSNSDNSEIDGKTAKIPYSPSQKPAVF